jgi:hypothetical protein
LILPDGKELEQQPISIKPFQPLQDGQKYRYLKFRSHFQAVELAKKGRVRLVANVDGIDVRIGALEVLEAEALLPSNASALLASYFRHAAKEISHRSTSKEELAKNFQDWARDFSSVLSAGAGVADRSWNNNQALVLPSPNGLRALFVRPISADEDIEVSGLPPDNSWRIVHRTPFATVIELDSVPVPLNEVRINVRARGAGRKRQRAKHS